MVFFARNATGQSSPRESRWPGLVALAGVALLTGLTFLPVLRGGFIGLDDGNNIFLNQQMGVLTEERVAGFFSDFSSARRYMPFGWLGFSAVFTWAGLEPGAYHAASLAWHVLAAVALFLAAQNILALHPQPTGRGVRTLLAALVALGWALHPLRTEAVAWASGLLYSQAAAWAFLAVWLWTLRWSATRGAGWLATGACLGVAVSLTTYPLAFGLVIVCWLLDCLAGRERKREPSDKTWAGRWHLGGGLLAMALGTGIVLIVTFAARRTAGETFAGMPSMQAMAGINRATQALYVWGYYLKSFALPGDIAPIYTTLYDVRTPSASLLAMAAFGGAGLLGGLLFYRRSIAVAGWTVAYTAMALPVLGLTEHPWITHDRYAGLLHPVIALGLAWLLMGWARHRYFPGLMAGAFALMLVAAVQARGLIGMWADSWSHIARMQQTLPRNGWAGYYLGQIPASVLFMEGRFAEIGPKLERAEASAPGWSAGPARDEYAGLIRDHEAFVASNWPGRAIPPQMVLHFLHGKAFQQRLDWATARAHFLSAAGGTSALPEAWLEAAWCELEMNRPHQARVWAERALASPALPRLAPREQTFWQLLAAVHTARGETEASAEVRQRLAERLKPAD